MTKLEYQYHPYKDIFTKLERMPHSFTTDEIELFQAQRFQYRIALMNLTYDELITGANEIYEHVGNSIIDLFNQDLISHETGTELSVIDFFELKLNEMNLTKRKIINKILTKKYEYRALLEILEQINKEIGNNY